MRGSGSKPPVEDEGNEWAGRDGKGGVSGRGRSGGKGGKHRDEFDRLVGEMQEAAADAAMANGAAEGGADGRLSLNPRFRGGE